MPSEIVQILASNRFVGNESNSNPAMVRRDRPATAERLSVRRIVVASLSAKVLCQIAKPVNEIPVHQIDELRFMLRVNIEPR